MATSKVTCAAGTYTSLGTATAGMLISPTGRIQVVAASSQPAANAAGHPLVYPLDGKPFSFAFNQQVWAQPLDGASVDVVVTI